MSTDSAATEHSDAITAYLMRDLKPQTRLDYYELSIAERSVLRAICAYSPNGAAFDKSLEMLARRASLSRKQVQRLINGYKRENRKVIGLKGRGILSELAPADKAREKPAVLRINWPALVLDPDKVHILERRMQQTLPGMKSPAVPEEESVGVTPAPVVKNPVHIPVEVLPPTGHRVQRPIDTVSSTLRTPCPPPLDTVSSDIGFNSLSTSLPSISSSHQPQSPLHPAVDQMKADFSKNKKPAWQWLEQDAPWLMHKLERELQLMAEAAVGCGPDTDGWSAERRARSQRANILLACQRAGIWQHVAERLAEEIYDSVLKRGY